MHVLCGFLIDTDRAHTYTLLLVTVNIIVGMLCKGSSAVDTRKVHHRKFKNLIIRNDTAVDSHVLLACGKRPTKASKQTEDTFVLTQHTHYNLQLLCFNIPSKLRTYIPYYCNSLCCRAFTEYRLHKETVRYKQILRYAI